MYGYIISLKYAVCLCFRILDVIRPISNCTLSVREREFESKLEGLALYYQFYFSVTVPEVKYSVSGPGFYICHGLFILGFTSLSTLYRSYHDG